MSVKKITSAAKLSVRIAVITIASLLFNRYTAFLLGVYIYSLTVLLLGGLGGVLQVTEIKSLMLFHLDEVRGVYMVPEYWELLLLVYLYAYFNMILRPFRYRALLAAVPLLLAYLGQDIYFLMYSNVFRVAELSEVPELLGVLSWPYLLLLAVFVLLPLGCFFSLINYRKPLVILAGAIPLAVVIGAVLYFPGKYIDCYNKVGQKIVFWSDAVSAVNNGRFMMLLYREAERQVSRSKTKTFHNREQYRKKNERFAQWIAANSTRRNVHLVVLESFLDPTLFKKASFNKDPFHPEFRQLFTNKLGLSISPVVGGKTSQAEFEILCGVPAFEEVAGMEFNTFTGAAAYCMPGKLQLAGYQTMASNAYNPSFFNTTSAYQGIGFDTIYFPREYVSGGETYIVRGDTTDEMQYMFDGELFDQNLDFIAPLLRRKNGPPLFNYVLTVYGHFPHLINEKKRPLVIRMHAAFKDAQLERSANQIYYRSQAIAGYIRRLLKLDPDSLIILVSDHLPPGQHGRKSFQKLRYLNNDPDSLHMNRIMIVEGGKMKKYGIMHHYDVPSVIYNSITNGAYCKVYSCGFIDNRLLDDRMSRHDDYMEIMAHAAE
ncbi:MAG: LTA synthase family protein [Desulfobulbus sp.]|nr:LTA synthase family protein [Desulfobulbus sp.]